MLAPFCKTNNLIQYHFFQYKFFYIKQVVKDQEISWLQELGSRLLTALCVTTYDTYTYSFLFFYFTQLRDVRNLTFIFNYSNYHFNFCLMGSSAVYLYMRSYVLLYNYVFSLLLNLLRWQQRRERTGSTELSTLIPLPPVCISWIVPHCRFVGDSEHDGRYRRENNKICLYVEKTS